MNKKNAIILTIMILFLGLLISGGTYAYWSWTNNSHKNIVFNTAKELQEYIVYDEGNSSFIGSLEVGNSFNQGIHSTISIKKTAEAANVDLVASIMMDINLIGTNMKQSSALKWVVTSGDSTNVGNVLAQGNFIGTNSGDILTLYPSIEVTTTEKKFTIWIWLDASENPSELLSGETLDTVVWTQIDQLEGVHDTFEITRISANYQNISATVVNNKYLITDYAVTNSNTTPSNWTTITSADQSHVYTLNYTALSTGTYYVWFKDSNGAIVSESVKVTIVDTTGPNCTFGSFSKSAVNNGGKTTINLDCVDNESIISVNNLKNSDFVLSENNAEITNINKTSITNGYRYTITLTGTSTDGLVTLTLPQNKIRNATNYGNSEAISGNLMIDNVKPVCTLSTPATVAFGNTTTAILTCTDNYLINSQTLANSNFTTSNTSVATINSISEPTTVSGGFQYTVTLNALKPGTYSLKLNANSVSDAAGNKNELTSSSNATVSKVNCPAPTNVQIASNGDITFTAPTVSAGTISYQISTNSSSGFTTITNGGNYLGSIVSQTGSRTVYVRSVCESTYYNTPSDNATATTTVYSVTLEEATNGKTFINYVDDIDDDFTYDEKSINVITGGTAYLYAQADNTYKFIKWDLDEVFGTITNSGSVNTTVTNVTGDSYIIPFFDRDSYKNTTTNVLYTTLNDAFANVQNNQTIQVLYNTTERMDATLASGKTGVKLDLNGKTVTLEANSLINNGGLDIYSSVDGGTIQGSSIFSTQGVINNKGTLTINGTSNSNTLTIRNTNTTVSTTVIYNDTGASTTLNNNSTLTFSNAISNCTSSSYRYLIKTQGTVNVSGGSLIQNSGSDNCQAGIAIVAAAGKVVMNSGLIQTRGWAINNYSGTTANNNTPVTINGGTLESTASGTFPGNANVNGINSVIMSYGNSSDNTIYITGGTINAKGSDCNGIYGNSKVEVIGGVINVTGENGAGIFHVENSSGVVMSGGTINSVNFGVVSYFNNFVMTGGTINADIIGIRTMTSNTEFTLGSDDGTVSTTVPSVNKIGDSSNGCPFEGPYKGKLNFYDGIITSTNTDCNFGLTITLNNTPTDYSPYISVDNGIKRIILKPSYNINYVLNGGTMGENAPTFILFDNDVVISNPIKTGYTFAGWTSSSADGLGANAKSGTSANPTTSWDGSATTNTYFKILRDGTGTVTLTANWKRNNYQNMNTNAYYETLAEAFSDVSSNQTIKALTGYGVETTNPTISTEKSGVIFDLNGQTIDLGTNCIVVHGNMDMYSSSSAAVLQSSIVSNSYGVLYSDGTLTLNDTDDSNTLTIQNTSSDASAKVIRAGSSANVTIQDNVTITFLNAIVDNSDNTSRYLISNRSGNIIINGGNFINLHGEYDKGFINEGTGLVRINGGTIHTSGNSIYNLSTSQDPFAIVITGGTITSENASTIYANSDGYIKLTGGSITSNSTSSSAPAFYNYRSTSKLIVDGSNIISSGMAVINNGTMIVNSGTITGDLYGTYNKNVLQVNGGSIISNSSEGIYNYNNNSSVEITGGTVSTYATSGKYAIHNHGSGSTLTISGGTISSDSTAAIVNSGANAALNISGDPIIESTSANVIIINSNTGIVNIDGGTIRTSSGNSIYHNSAASINITGGIITSSTGKGIFNNSTGVVNIGGTVRVESTDSNAVYGYSNAGIINITGGNIKSINEDAVCNRFNGTLNVSGGTIISEIKNGLSSFGSGTINITGGTIEGRQNGIYNTGSSTIITLGSLDLIPDNNNPVIISNATSDSYGIAKGSGTLNYYGGKIISHAGANHTMSANPTDIYPTYSVSKTVSDGIETAVLVPNTVTMMPAKGIINGTDDGSSIGYFLNTTIPRNSIVSISFSNQLDQCTINTSDCFDISNTQDGSVKMSGSNGNYTISQNNGVVLPYNSSSLFYNLVNLTSIAISDVIMTNVDNMSYMFYGNSSVSHIALPRANYVVTNIEGMFSGCTNLSHIQPLSTISSNAQLTNINNAFLNTTILNDDTLKEILYLSAVSTSIDTDNRNATYLGLSQDYYDGRFNNSSLSNYNAYVDAGWTFWD